MLYHPLFLLGISVFLFLGYMLFIRKTGLHRYLLALVLFLYVNITSIYLIADYYTAEGVNNAFIYHLKYGVDGAGIENDIPLIIFGIIGFTTSIVFPLYLLLRYRKIKEVSCGVLLACYCYTLLGVSFILHPFAKNMYELKYGKIQTKTVKEVQKKAEFKDVYTIPEKDEDIEKKRNLVVIYLESFEQLFTDEEVFPGLTPKINELKKDATVFNNIEQSYGASWTIAGMVGSQCGIPLLDSGGGGNSMHGISEFLPKAYCMGDFLKESGYHLHYMGGADKGFAGKGNFYITHQFDEVEGKVELLERIANKKYIYNWGLYDDSLFELAKLRYDYLLKQKSPFGLFMISLDTHGKDGVVSHSCKNKKYNHPEYKILDSYHCTDFQVTDFIKHIQKKDENTMIVLLSDHYAMTTNPSTKDINNSEKERKLLFMILDSTQPSKEITTFGQTIDIAPTILSQLGFKVPALGLGVDILGRKQTLTRRYPDFRFSDWNKYYRDFWSFPDIKKGITVQEWKIQLGGNTIAVPNILELQSEGEVSNIIFKNKHSKNSLSEKLPVGKKFIFIDYGEKGEKIFTFSDEIENRVEKIYKDGQEITFSEIEEVFGELNE